MVAASNGHADCARLLLDAGADKNAQDEVRLLSIVVFHIFDSPLSMLNLSMM